MQSSTMMKIGYVSVLLGELNRCSPYDCDIAADRVKLFFCEFDKVEEYGPYDCDIADRLKLFCEFDESVTQSNVLSFIKTNLTT